jgi:transposase
VRVEKVPWAERWSRVTKSLARAAAELARRTDLSTVATQFSINWKTVAGILRRVVRWGLARRHLDQWLWWASHSRLEPFQNFARMIRKHKDGILAWTKLRISNGALEGMNNKVKLVSHRSYGFRSGDRYIEAIYHNCANLLLPSES